MRRRAVLTVPLLALPAAAQPSLAGALRGGGVVAVMRHGITDRSQADTGDLSRREAQRNLSEAGRTQSRRTGLAFAALGIPLGEVRASPVIRARDTATLVFGARAEVEPMLTADDYTPDPRQLARQIAWLRARVLSPSGPAVTDVLVGHIVPLGMMLGRGLSQAEYPEGALAIFAPTGLLGILPAEDFWVAAGV